VQAIEFSYSANNTTHCTRCCGCTGTLSSSFLR